MNIITPEQRAREEAAAQINNKPQEDGDITASLQKLTELIMAKAEKYGATQELLSMDEVNIESLDALIAKYNVTSDDKNDIMFRVQMIAFDIMAKLRMTWYDIWNEKVKPVLNNMSRKKQAKA